MAKRAGKVSRPVQLSLWGGSLPEPRALGVEFARFFFDSSAVRVVVVGGRLWFVLADVARVLGYKNAADAGKVVRDRQKGMQKVHTPGGTQEMLVISEGGVNRLISRSNHPKAEEIQEWIEEEVIPSILATGSYSMRTKTRSDRIAARLGCDSETADVRCDQYSTNKATHENILAAGGGVRDIVAWYEVGYQKEFGKSTSELRSMVGAREGQTPLDFMSLLPLSINQHAKALATKVIEVAEKSGIRVPPSDRASILSNVMEDVKNQALERFSPAACFAVIEDPKRGKVIDLVIPAIAS
jgi:prophage antirepressor-like protein